MTAPQKPGHTPRFHRKASDMYEPQARTATSLASEKARRVEDARLRKVFAERMYRARVEMRGWSQLHAAKLLGFGNSSPLAKIEMGESFARTMPGIAARVYGVSTDFLLGVSDFEDEISPTTGMETAIMNANMAFWQTKMIEQAKVLARYCRVSKVTIDGMATLVKKSAGLKEAFTRVQELNPDVWAECRGGTRLETAITELEEACAALRRDAARAKIELLNQGHAAGITELLTETLEQIA